MQNNIKDLINIIETKSSIVDIVSDYVSLEKRGNNYIGLCPFHSDSNPSMSVSDQKGIFKCFSCGAGGGPISFVQNYEGISFIETLKKLSDKYNIEWKKYINFVEKKINIEEEKGYKINNQASIFFSYNLKNLKNDEVINYVASRNLSNEIISKFKIGFSGKNGSLSKFLLAKKFTKDEIVKYGLGKIDKNGELFDFFINRLIFPIENANGDILGFSGRIINKNKYSKYINSPETPIFKKSKILYNTSNAKIKASLQKELIIVEGFMDVISLYKSSIEYAVATMGTTFTNDHVNIISKITNNIILAFDSDVAGINAGILAGKLLYKKGINVNWITIPNGKDFDELYKDDKNKIIEIINNKIPFLEFYKNIIYSKLDKKNNIVSFDEIRKLIELISYSNDDIMINFILNEISTKYNIDKNILETELNKKNYYRSNKNNEPWKKEIKKKSKINDELNLMFNEQVILSYAIKNNDAFEYLQKNPITFFRGSMHNLWFSFMNYKNNNISINDPELEILLEKMINEDYINEINKNFREIESIKQYGEYINKYKELINSNMKNILTKEIKDSSDNDEIRFLLSNLKKIS